MKKKKTRNKNELVKEERGSQVKKFADTFQNTWGGGIFI